MNMIRKPAIAGSFYPFAADELKMEIESLMQFVSKYREKHLQHQSQKAPYFRSYVIPHAAYVYSGFCAATAYSYIADQLYLNPEINRIVIIGPTHQISCRGLLIPKSNEFETPMGIMPIDGEFNSILMEKFDFISESEEGHLKEHSIEIQVPFLQYISEKRPESPIQIVPILAGSLDPIEVEKVFQYVLSCKDTLLIISSDLSHFENYHDANQHDRETIEKVLNKNWKAIRLNDACGAIPLAAMVKLSESENYQAQLIYHCNSGDIIGDKDRVVGYGSFSFYKCQESDD